MNRTPYRVILPEKFIFIPLEGVNRMEYDMESRRIVSYLTEEEYRLQNTGTVKSDMFHCTITDEPGLLDRTWMKIVHKLTPGSNNQKIIMDGPQIIPHITVVYVKWKEQIIGKFYSYDSEGIVFSQKGAISYAEIFVEQLINNEL